MYGLKERDLDYIGKALKAIPSIVEGVIFGSRAMGNYKPGSDIDLAVKGEGVTRQEVIRLSDMLNEVYPIPFVVDVVHYDSIVSEGLKRHIDQVGCIVYGKDHES
ncbi:nucleotidyltransferase family protein [Anaerotalea alkaliphila]|uniref:Nucleotidyltransferase domain-containing protein n=1 Tax=Anaerotalea alkaliphila TaxID=2662126 RepID=A0A7X5HWA5_9FIRM|nr:nucleotidyltransferase domain-containing protein [Anaerotalea alkaliphila]NDL67839.1 nucleotidyltransferase domain-containing protein [Anaerotalea alkaliphila]